MKNLIITGVLCLVGNIVSAQIFTAQFSNNAEQDEKVSPAVKERIEEFASEIRVIVIEEKLAMNEEIEKLADDLKNQKITSEDAENQKAAIALQFSEKINARIDKLSFDLDEIIKQQVKFSIMNTDVNELIKEKEYKKNRTIRPVNHVSGFLAYGLISFSGKENQKLNDHNHFNSGIDLGLTYNRQLSRTSPFTFKSGFYFSWRTIRFSDRYMINRDENGLVDLIKNEHHLSKSKLRATYLMFPLGFEFSTAKLKFDSEDKPYRNVSEGISFTLNVYGGFRLSNNNIVKGDDVRFRDKKTNYNLNNFAYGGQFTLSLYDVKFFVRQEFSPYFKDGTFDDRKMIQFGVTTGF